MALLDLLSLLGRKRTWIWLVLLEAVAVFLCVLPALRRVTGTPGFAFAFLVGLVATVAAGHLGLMAAARVRECGPAASAGGLVRRAWAAGWGASLTLLVPPLVTVLVAGYWNGRCNYSGGLLFFLALPVASTALAAALGVVLGLAVRRRFLGFWLFIGVALASLGYTLYRLMSEAPIFAFDPLFGYWPGAIYDELLTVGAPLGWFRLESAILTVALLATGASCADAGRGILRWRSRRPRTLVLALLLWGAFALLRSQGGKLGYFVSTADVAAALGGRHETKHFVIYYPKDQRHIVRRIWEIGLDHEFRYEQLRRYLGAEPKGRVYSFLYASRAQKARLMGARRVSIAKPWIRQLHLHDMGFPNPILRHELAHVFGGAFGSWFGVSARGPFSYNVGLIEGLAVAADWSLGYLTGHQWARAAEVIKGKQAPRLEKLIQVTGFWGESASLAYTLCGSFSRYLIDTYGAARFRDVYRDGDFDRAYARPLPSLVREWEQFLRGVKLSPAELAAARRRFRRPSIFRRVCAHEVARLRRLAGAARARGRYGREVELRRRILALAPAAVGEVESLAGALVRWKRYREAHALVLRELARRRRGNERLVELQADLWWREDRLSRARRSYGKLRPLASPPDARRLAVKIAAIDHPRVGPALRRFLLDDWRDRAVRLLDLREVIAQAPDFAPAIYLLGRQLFFARRYAQAARHLSRALTLRLPGLALTVEAQRLLGVSTFLLGDYAGARRIFKAVSRSGLSQGSRLAALDWMQRCVYFRERQGARPRVARRWGSAAPAAVRRRVRGPARVPTHPPAATPAPAGR